MRYDDDVVVVVVVVISLLPPPFWTRVRSARGSRYGVCRPIKIYYNILLCARALQTVARSRILLRPCAYVRVSPIGRLVVKVHNIITAVPDRTPVLQRVCAPSVAPCAYCNNIVKYILYAAACAIGERRASERVCRVAMSRPARAYRQFYHRPPPRGPWRELACWAFWKRCVTGPVAVLKTANIVVVYVRLPLVFFSNIIQYSGCPVMKLAYFSCTIRFSCAGSPAPRTLFIGHFTRSYRLYAISNKPLVCKHGSKPTNVPQSSRQLNKRENIIQRIVARALM